MGTPNRAQLGLILTFGFPGKLGWKKGAFLEVEGVIFPNGIFGVNT